MEGVFEFTFPRSSAVVVSCSMFRSAMSRAPNSPRSFRRTSYVQRFFLPNFRNELSLSLYRAHATVAHSVVTAVPSESLGVG